MAHAFKDVYVPMFPKPCQIAKEKPWIKIFPDGREVLDTKTEKGAYEYSSRKWKMLERQGRMCCFYGFIPECPGPLRRADATFDHENKRAAGKRDDRIEVKGIWQNGAAHMTCNGIVGSRRIEYSRTIQARRSEYAVEAAKSA